MNQRVVLKVSVIVCLLALGVLGATLLVWRLIPSTPSTPSSQPPPSTLGSTPGPSLAAIPAATPISRPAPPRALPDSLAVFLPGERQRLLEIVQDVLARHGSPGPREYREFRGLIKKLGLQDAQAIAALQERLTGPYFSADRYFWEDALEARIFGRPVASEKRRTLERAMLEAGLFTKADLAERDDRIQRIADRMPITLPGMIVVLDERAISEQLQQLEADRSGVNALFVPE